MRINDFYLQLQNEYEVTEPELFTHLKATVRDQVEAKFETTRIIKKAILDCCDVLIKAVQEDRIDTVMEQNERNMDMLIEMFDIMQEDEKQCHAT